MLNKATKLMDQRNNMIKEAYQVLNVLGVDVAQQVINQITINKGKIVKVEVANNEELDRLCKENDRHMRRINELYVTIDDYQLRMNCLEDEIHFRDEQILGYQNQIKQLEEEVKTLKAQMITTKVEEVIDVKAPEIIIDEPEELTYDENDEVL